MGVFEIILAAIIVFLGLIMSYKWKVLNNFKKIVLSLIVITAIILTIVQIKNNIDEAKKEYLIQRINSKFGELIFNSEPKPKIMIGNGENSSSIEISINNILIDRKSGKPLLKVDFKGGRLLVYVLIRDLYGNVIAVIDGDTWTVFDDDYEYNDEKGKAFELVTKGERKVYFQIEYKNGNVYLSGHLFNPDGFGMVFYATEPPNGFSGLFMYRSRSQLNDLKKIHIRRIFKYPRGKHYGERL